jgi:hypothetical protein
MEVIMTESERNLREIHGDLFADEMDEMIEEFNQEVQPKTLKQKTIRFLYSVLYYMTNSPMALWVAGFIDGIILMAVLRYMGWF